MKAIPDFHPAGVLRTTNFAPGETVYKPTRSVGADAGFAGAPKGYQFVLTFAACKLVRMRNLEVEE